MIINQKSSPDQVKIFNSDQKNCIEYDLTELLKATQTKNNQGILRSHYANFDLAKLERAENCHRVIVCGKYQHSKTQQIKLKIDQFSSCCLRFCSCCTWRRAIKFSTITYKTIKQAQQEMKLRFLFLTLTVKNPPMEDLKETVRHMQKAFRRMSQTVKWKNSILGYCRVLEVTQPRKNAYQMGNIHPHFHVLLAVKSTYFNSKSGKYLTKNDYAGMWQKALGVDYIPVCDVRICKAKGDKQAEIAAIAELIKYPIKDTDLELMNWQKFKLLDEQMRGIRSINYGGILKDANKAIDDESLDIEAEDLELWQRIERVIMKYHTGQKRYIPLESDTKGILTDQREAKGLNMI